MSVCAKRSTKNSHQSSANTTHIEASILLVF